MRRSNSRSKIAPGSSVVGARGKLIPQSCPRSLFRRSFQNSLKPAIMSIFVRKT